MELEPEISSKLPDDLLQSILEGRCVMFIGAGLSCQIRRSNGKHLPTWDGLLRELINDTASMYLSRAEREQMLATLEKRKYLDVAESLNETIPRDAMQSAFVRIFGDPSVRPGPMHRLIPQIRLRCVLTSNYDTLVEDSFVDYEGEQPLSFTFSEYGRMPCPIRNPRFFILKVHGDYKNYDDIVLGARSYARIIHLHPLSRHVLQTLLSSYTFLFVGYGGADPDLDSVIDELSTIFGPIAAPHYLVVPSGRFDPIERRRMLLDRRLEVVQYDAKENHRQLGDILASLTAGSILRYLDEASAGRCQVFISVHRSDVGSLSDLLDFLEQTGTSFLICHPNELWVDSLDRLRSQIERSTIVLHVYSAVYHEELDFVLAIAHQSSRPSIALLLNDSQAPRFLQDCLCCRVCSDQPRVSMEHLADFLSQFRTNPTGPSLAG